MRFLLTSAGIKNTSIRDALLDLLLKPIADSNALCIPTAGHGHPQGSPTMAEAGRWAAEIAGPAYAIDDEIAIIVTDGSVEVVSEGHWKLFTPRPGSPALGAGCSSSSRVVGHAEMGCGT